MAESKERELIRTFLKIVDWVKFDPECNCQECGIDQDDRFYPMIEEMRKVLNG